jgi:hypothetical protein
VLFGLGRGGVNLERRWAASGLPVGRHTLSVKLTHGRPHIGGISGRASGIGMPSSRSCKTAEFSPAGLAGYVVARTLLEAVSDA